MNKKLVAVLATVCATCAVVGFASCNETPTVTYTLNSTGFESTKIVYNSPFDYSHLVIEGSDGTSVPVTASMVTGADTSSVGEKTLTVSYAEMTTTVNYTVKYKVEFVAETGDKDTQFVLSSEEIVIPTGYTADDWTPAIPDMLTDNMTFTEKTQTGPTEVEVSFKTDGPLVLDAGAGVASLGLNVTTGAAWEVVSSNDNVTLSKVGNTVMVNAAKAGVTTLTVTATGHNCSATAVKAVVVKPSEFVIAENGASYGVEGVRTLGRTDVRGEVSNFPLTLGAGQNVGNLNEYVVWESNNGLATVEEGVITLASGTGAATVEFTAKFVVGGVTYNTSAPFTARCVFDGVNVSNYEDLWTATKNSKPVVLNANIAFPTNVSDIHYDIMNTTYDDTFYKNLNQPELAKIKTLLQFKNDLYGNGYVINAHNATLGLLDNTGKLTNNSIFRGPLDFVAMTSSGVSAVSVKGQDNVCFAVFEGVTINNVELRGCDLTADPNGEYDLTQLNYAGTTVEVFGDDVTIEYSRINNGRTVLRVFGDAADATKEIHLNVKNSVLSGAREFIIRMGSNCFVQGTTDNVSPYIDGERNLINDKKNYKTMTAAEQAAYDQAYIKTFVTLKNCVLKDAGIFAIGIDSHFAGGGLNDGSTFQWFLGESAQYWKNLAKTSYGAKLTFEGEVKMYNWKHIDQIDSSTLIEILDASILGDWENTFKFNVGEIVKNAVETYPDQYGTVMTEDGYVHAGLAFFGGGRNYGIFEDKTNSGQGLGLEGFQVSLEAVGFGPLENAAGEEPFYFNLYDSESTFTHQNQNKLLQSEDAYECIYNKD